MEEEQGFVERRRFPRYAVRYMAKVSKGEKDLFGTIIDISEGGLGILLPEIFPIGTELTLKIKSLIEGEISEIALNARLVWMHDEEFTNGMYRGGLEITEISQEALDMLKDHIQSLDEQGQ